ncbi:MAG: IscS subfamily cysteine desulfurase [Ignavibacteria bacterium]|nr:IscS subfamily cysteine desulfurase [Ignavibacteria bacterium]
MIKFPIYLDNHSTTKVDPRVLEAMLPYFTEYYGNASSKSHEFGWKAEAAVEFARKQCARLVNCEPRDIIFTSGATESVNLALKGAAEANAAKGNHIITSLIEHEAVLDTCKNLESRGFRVTYLPVDEFGMVSPETLEKAITPQTILVSIMWVNNEIGTIQPIGELSEVCREKKILFHTDATQAVGKLPIDLAAMHIDLMSFSSHKIYGPKGAGALYKKGKIPRVRITPQLDGGAQEKGLRAGTLNVPGIVGFGKACEIAMTDMAADQARIKELRERLYSGLIGGVENIKLNGHPEKRINGNLNISISNIDADSLMISIKDIAVSTGSACSSESVEPSHVLTAIGIDNKLKRSTIRFGVGKFNTAEEIDYTIEKVTEKVKYLFSIMPEAKRNMKGDHASV